MTPTSLLLVFALSATAQAPAPGGGPPMTRSERLLALHWADAESYVIARDPDRRELLTLVKDPVYRWTNPTRNGGQEGDVFVWTYHGRPEAVGCIFSHPLEGHRRTVNHEFHSLSPVVLYPEPPGKAQWQPRAPGVDWRPLDGPAPAATANGRRTQLTALARAFTAESHLGGPPVRLRLLPHPLYRYASTDPDVIDGALFAFVTSAGTDPEILLLIEAHRDGAEPRWFASGARFSDWALRLSYKGKEIWSSPRAAIGTFANDELHRYRFYNDRVIEEIVEPLRAPR